MAARPTKPLPSAAARTISLFTGMADVDDREPGRARDGTRSETPRRLPSRKTLKWDGGVSRWHVIDGPRGDSYVVEKVGDKYVASYFFEKLGTHDDILAAGDACEAHFAKGRSR